MMKIDLTTFCLSIAHAAYLNMGLVDEGAEQAGTQNPPLDLGAARHNIDLLELLFEKTKGNRTPEEDQLLERLLFDVRMQYVDRTRPS